MKISAQVSLTIDFNFHPNLSSDLNLKDQAADYISSLIAGQVHDLTVTEIREFPKEQPQ